MNQRVCALTSLHGWSENVGLWEPTRTLGGLTAHCSCSNYNRKKDVSAHRSSYCGPCSEDQGAQRCGALIRQPHGWRGGSPEYRWVTLLSQVASAPLLLGGRLLTTPLSRRAANHSRCPGWSGKVEKAMETKPGLRGGQTARLRPSFQGG